MLFQYLQYKLIDNLSIYSHIYLIVHNMYSLYNILGIIFLNQLFS
ncbi:unnamed protein product [Schistosoma mattheei]|uniref:Uncharacterized protein n=1 Tax=Schistosoma mattheei TaxID=31246 RepID=A0A3P8F8A8_9TREM|nr:unnamed protein product [Schistosoma mattheei]